uniref:Uncharacterized protein n=1 Tax=Maylandia zebra TaxID=106582 RepID=A0A3P9DSE6_9CICH
CCVIVTAVCTAAGAIGAVVTAPALLGVAGFNSAGIAAGSCAAGMMSSAAASNGGEVTAGSVVAVLHLGVYLGAVFSVVGLGELSRALWGREALLLFPLHHNHPHMQGL